MKYLRYIPYLDLTINATGGRGPLDELRAIQLEFTSLGSDQMLLAWSYESA